MFSTMKNPFEDGVTGWRGTISTADSIAQERKTDQPNMIERNLFSEVRLARKPSTIVAPGKCRPPRTGGSVGGCRRRSPHIPLGEFFIEAQKTLVSPGPATRIKCGADAGDLRRGPCMAPKLRLAPGRQCLGKFPWRESHSLCRAHS